MIIHYDHKSSKNKKFSHQNALFRQVTLFKEIKSISIMKYKSLNYK